MPSPPAPTTSQFSTQDHWQRCWHRLFLLIISDKRRLLSVLSRRTFKMLSAEVQGIDGLPTSTFNFVLKSPVTPVRPTFSPAPASPNISSHRRVRSRGRSLDRRTKNTDRLLSHSCSPPTTKISQVEPREGLDHGQEGFKVQHVELTVEKNLFHSNMIDKVMKVIDDCKALGIGQDIELPRVSNSSNLCARILLTAT